MSHLPKKELKCCCILCMKTTRSCTLWFSAVYVLQCAAVQITVLSSDLVLTALSPSMLTRTLLKSLLNTLLST